MLSLDGGLSVVPAGGPVDQRGELLVRSALDRILGLTVDLSPFEAMAARDPLLRPLASRLRGQRPPRFPTVFEALVNGVAQQLPLAVGFHLLNRLTADCGRPVFDDPNGPRAFPGPQELAALEVDDPPAPWLQLRQGAHDPRDRAGSPSAASLTWRPWSGSMMPRHWSGWTSRRGIGRWTAEYVLLRGLGRLHIFPGDDVGAHNKLRHLSRDRQAPPCTSWSGAGIRTRGVVYFHLLLDSLVRTGLVAHSHDGGHGRP